MEEATLQELSAKLFAHVDRLAGLIGPRHLGKAPMLDAARTYIEREITECGYSVEPQTYLAAGHEVANLVAELVGQGRREEIVVVGAHYDTIATSPGADDNASGVAMLIEVARHLRSECMKRTVRFVAFPCEEPPYFHTGEMGSQVYARRCRSLGERIKGMLCLEMVGYFTEEPNSQQIPASIPNALRRVLPTTGNFLAAVGNARSARLLWQFRQGFKRASRFPLLPLALPESIQEIRLSDNSSFWDQGYPALMITDTSFLRNPHYHLASDTPETLDYGRMAELVSAISGGIMSVALRTRRRYHS